MLLKYFFNKAEKKSNTSELALLLLITSISLYFRVTGLSQESFWINEADNTRVYYFTSAREMLAWGPSEVLGIGAYSLLYYFYALLSPEGFLLESEFGYRLPSAIFSTITIPMLYFISKRYANPIISLAVCSIWAFNPLGFELGRWFYSYPMWTFFTLLALLSYFQLVDSIRQNRTKKHNWILFHTVSLITFMSNIFIILAYLCVIPHFLSTISSVSKTAKDRNRLAISAFAPHFLPCAYIIQRSLRLSKQGFEETSWISSTPGNPMLHVMEISFPSAHNLLFIMLLFLLINLVYRLTVAIGSFKELSDILWTHLGSDKSPLILASIAQPMVFIMLGILGSPSWEDRYMGHLIPLWQLSLVFLFIPRDFSLSLERGGPFDFIPPLSMFLVIFISLFSSVSQVSFEENAVKQDVRASIQFVSDEWNSTERSAIITQPSPQIYRYYLDRYDLNPEFFEGSWEDVDSVTLDTIISSKPDVIFRIRLVEFSDSTGFLSTISENYILVEEFSSTGMVVQKWELSR